MFKALSYGGFLNIVRQLHDDIVVAGWSCRFPGANSISALWSLLLDGRCAVSWMPQDRILLERFGHPRRNERGKSYTWAAGVIDDVWGFDPTVFGISPREAEQMDPQQRILLELTWEALEDAGILPSAIAGSNTGVFVGASLVDYANAVVTDPAVVDSHFGTGNALAVLSNRISYVFDLHGPSITVDTACSSSLVALHQAMEAIRASRIDTAIVAGINIIGSHTAFILFSQAAMLSPTGLCQAFDAKADGFVRGEGGAVIILRRAAMASAERNPIHGVILASDVNSDGRTNGIALPSGEAQENLLKRIYARAAIASSRIAFIEAHGTGTAAGDPIEATAIGRSLGVDCPEPLPIGSIKTNIGHLEPASGLAGLLKALLALNHGILPQSLHCTEPNPHIDFSGLNVTVCTQQRLLPDVSRQCAGVNSFGFGGTNAHVVVAAGRHPSALATPQSPNPAHYLLLSAETKSALMALAQEYVRRIDTLSPEGPSRLANATAYRRERLSNRLVVSLADGGGVVGALRAFTRESGHPQLTVGTAVGRDLAPAFVYSGNGSQWAGMGIAAYRRNAVFRAQFDRVDSHFGALAGWSLRETLVSADLGKKLECTSVAQPLIFAIQSAATAALRARGLVPAITLGHSVGEVAAAEAAGALDLKAAVRVIYYRSKHQETVRGRGEMAVLMTAPDRAAEIAAMVPGLEIAAVNSPRAVTMAGTAAAIAALKAMVNGGATPFVDLGLGYPFHTAQMAAIETALMADLSTLAPRDAEISFVSTVTGSSVAGSQLGARYWWRNIREPVQFMAGIREAAKLGARYFVEVGPNSTLIKHIADSLSGQATGYATLGVLERKEADGDPFDKAVAQAVIAGVRSDDGVVFGKDTGENVELPGYPWQRTRFRYNPTVEALGVVESERHPLAGARLSGDALEWHCHVDTALLPAYADHTVGSQTILPGTAFLEIAFSVARQWLKTDQVTIANFEILTPLDLTNGESHEVMTRVSPGSNTVEILSRRRLARGGWTVHCRGKMLLGHAGLPGLQFAAAKSRPIATRDALYRLADASGLHYGPAFRLVDRVRRDHSGLVRVDLNPATAPTRYVADPIRIDACTHGLITAFAALRAPERGVAYVPVRIDEASVRAPHGVPQTATFQLVSKNERAIVANCEIFAADGTTLVTFRGVRCQAVPVRRLSALESIAMVERLQPADGQLLGRSGVAVRTADILDDANALGLAERTKPTNAATELLEGWATAAAYEIARGLGRRGRLDLRALVDAGRIAHGLQPWLTNLLHHLSAAGLARDDDGRWLLTKDPALPRSTKIIATLAREYPERAAELLLASEVTELASQVVQTRSLPVRPVAPLTPAALDFFTAGNSAAREAGTILLRLLQRNERLLAPDRALRVLMLGAELCAQGVAQYAFAGCAQVTIFEPDEGRRGRLQTMLPRSANVAVLSALDELRGFDLIVAAHGLSYLRDDITIAQLRQALLPDGLLVAIEPQPSFFRDLVFGLDAGWFSANIPEFPVGPLRTTTEWQATLTDAGFKNCHAITVEGSARRGTLVLGEADSASGHARAPRAAEDQPAVLLVLDKPAAREQRLAAALADVFAANKVATQILVDDPIVASPSDCRNVIHILPSVAEPASAVAELTERCLMLKARAEQIANAKATIWLVLHGAVATSTAETCPIARALWVFSRTLANEFPQLDIRRIDIAIGTPVDIAAARVHSVIISTTTETELHLDRASIGTVRADSVRCLGGAIGGGPAQAVRLERRVGASQRLHWQPVDRTAPGVREIEIAVAATGLNFRDLMWMLSLLPDDILEDGFAGPTLGLECAGRVTRVGRSVKGLRIGDRVVAFAGGAFASHVTVPVRQVAKLPTAMPDEAAATVPVAFMTAYYALVTQARLKRGEWVLIHGGAGGVGLAAIQIARLRGAKIIATAGSPAKRALLKAMGVRHILDSRSTTFIDGVRRITGAGVDVVLNSLAGEAMEQSVACLRSFGRFVELGKRDYVANTHLGLRPFRKNLSYFGIDIDQLIGRGDVGPQIFANIMRQFKRGALTALPYVVLEAEQVADAFHLMQQSAHIGKIVVRPPRPEAIHKATRPFAVSATGTHLITGAFGGFGLETAKWLVDNGARHLVLIGRRGPVTQEANAAVAALRVRGVRVIAEPCDVSDGDSITQLLAKVRATMPPLVGVIHAAMVLDDTIVANLDADRLRRVLAPKVEGAENLDRLTRSSPLEYFVLFSSVTTLIGNPGQGNYVAANAYMEGLARRRHRQGLPALAIGWGPITDFGAVARSAKLRAGLEKLTGARGMTAREALDLMAEALAWPADSPALAVMTIAPNDGSFGGDRLVVLRSPTYAGLISDRSALAGDDSAKLDVQALIRTEDEETVRRKVGDMIAMQLARVLHFRPEDLSRTRPLAEIGLDSLMALELGMNLEMLFGIQIALAGSAGTLTIAGLADDIIAQATPNAPTLAAAIAPVAHRHAATIEPAQIAALTELVEATATRPRPGFMS